VKGTVTSGAMRNIFSNTLLCVFYLSLILTAEAQSTEKVDFNCDSDFRSVIQTNEALLVAGIDVTRASNGRKYLLALGTTINQAKDSPEAKAKLDTRKVGEAKARAQAAGFLDPRIETETKLDEIRNSERVSTNDGLKQQLTKIIKIREEIIVQRSQVILGGSKVVATWFSDDNSYFYVVVAVEIPGKDNP